MELTQPVLTAWSLAAWIGTQPFACTQYFATESTLLWKWLTLEDSHILLSMSMKKILVLLSKRDLAEIAVN